MVYRDKSADFAFLTKSTAASIQTIEWEGGNTYPVIDIEVSAASHPFCTGQATIMDTDGRVERFRKRHQRSQS